MRRKNAGHVRVKVGLLAVETNVRFRETDHEVAIEGAEYLAPGVIGDHEGDIRLSIEVAVAPDFAGDLDTAAKFVEGVEWADDNIGGHGDSASIKLSAFSFKFREKLNADARQGGWRTTEVGAAQGILSFRLSP